MHLRQSRKVVTRAAVWLSPGVGLEYGSSSAHILIKMSNSLRMIHSIARSARKSSTALQVKVGQDQFMGSS